MKNETDEGSEGSKQQKKHFKAPRKLALGGDIFEDPYQWTSEQEALLVRGELLQRVAYKN